MQSTAGSSSLTLSSLYQVCKLWPSVDQGGEEEPKDNRTSANFKVLAAFTSLMSSHPADSHAAGDAKATLLGPAGKHGCRAKFGGQSVCSSRLSSAKNDDSRSTNHH